jgi:hypothetical protein
MKPTTAVPRSLCLLAILALLILPAQARVKAAPAISAGLEELQPLAPEGPFQLDKVPGPQCKVRRTYLPIITR